MTDEEKSKELTRSSFVAQMAMLGYEPNGNPKDMVEVVRCKDCKHRMMDTISFSTHWCPVHTQYVDDEYFCADGNRRKTE